MHSLIELIRGNKHQQVGENWINSFKSNFSEKKIVKQWVKVPVEQSIDTCCAWYTNDENHQHSHTHTNTSISPESKQRYTYVQLHRYTYIDISNVNYRLEWLEKWCEKSEGRNSFVLCAWIMAAAFNYTANVNVNGWTVVYVQVRAQAFSLNNNSI